MSKNSGYSLIELMVVISIISMFSVAGFVSFKDFSSQQVPSKAVGQIQTALRLAQSNATSSTICISQPAESWSLVFNSTYLGLYCKRSNSPSNYGVSSTFLENAQIEKITGSSCLNAPLNPTTQPLTLTYTSNTGVITFSALTASPSVLPSCLASDVWTFVVKSTKDANKLKQFTISKRGAINVQ